MDAATLAGFLRRGLNDLKRKSPAGVGDKTMMDALVPAVEALEAKQAEPLATALRSATSAAKQGAQSTVGMLARSAVPRRSANVCARHKIRERLSTLFLESLTAAAEISFDSIHRNFIQKGS